MKKAFLSLIMLSAAITLTAQVKLASIFTDNMVLQRSSTPAIWGYSVGGDEVRLVGSWNLQDTVRVNSDTYGRWKTNISTPKAGGPYTLQVTNHNDQIIINNIMIGEVWICSGQSNMEWTYDYSDLHRKEEFISGATNKNIRIISTPRIGDDKPQSEIKGGTWEVCSSDVMRKSSAVAYHFAKHLSQELDIPVGIIISAWGGTPAEVWIPKELVESDAEFMASYRILEGDYWGEENAGVLYNSMIAPIAPYGIKGAIWYQGETNTAAHQGYARLMKTLKDSWSKDFGHDLPFYMVQIAPFEYGDTKNAAFLREQQQIAAQTYKGIEMIAVHDIIDDNVTDIHPRNKFDVGIRLANIALATEYGKELTYLHPSYDNIIVEKEKAIISFKNLTGNLVLKGATVNDILIAGADGKFVKATAKLDGKKLIVSSKEVKEPKDVRFCFSNIGVGNLFSEDNMPVLPFRTDNYKK